jgi:hypothetical protein
LVPVDVFATKERESVDPPERCDLHEQIRRCDAHLELDLRLVDPDRQVLQLGGELVGARPLTKIDDRGHLPSPAARSAFFQVPNRRIIVQYDGRCFVRSHQRPDGTARRFRVEPCRASMQSCIVHTSLNRVSWDVAGRPAAVNARVHDE